MSVLIAVFGLGWLGTQLYSMLDPANSQSSAAVTPYVLMGRQLASSLDVKGDHAQHDVVDFFVQNWSAQGPLNLSLAELDDFPLPSHLLKNFKNGNSILLEDGANLLINYYLPSRTQILTLTLAKSDLEQGDFATSLSLTLVFYCGLIAILLTWFYPLLRRLILMQRSAASFGAGKLDERIPLSRWSYIPRLEQSFNQMADRVENLVADNRLLSRAVSHDLKTPIARLRFGFEMLAESQDKQQTSRYLKRIDQDLMEMESLIARLLEYAKLEEAQVKLDFQPLEINSLLQRLCEPLIDDCRHFELLLCPSQLWISADVHYLKMMLNNVLSNAIRYARSTIRVTTQQFGTDIRLVIADDGPGIAEADRENLLKPFVRGNDSKKAGHGMGLAIVERLAKWHRAKLILDNDPDLAGAQVQLIFGSVKEGVVASPNKIG